MKEQAHRFGIPKPFPILDTGRPPTDQEQRQAAERFQQGTEHPIVTREQLAQKRDKAFGIKP